MKMLRNLAKPQFLEDEIEKTPILPILPSAKWLFVCISVDFIIQELKFYNFEGMRENKKHIL